MITYRDRNMWSFKIIMRFKKIKQYIDNKIQKEKEIVLNFLEKLYNTI